MLVGTRAARGCNETDLGVLGRDWCGGGGVSRIMRKRRERGILMENAESRLSGKFRSLRLKFRILSGEIQR